MRVAAYQAPLSAAGSGGIIGHIEQRVRWCESEGVTLLCCPEAVIGGLADYSNEPARYALRAAEGELVNILAPLASGTVTSIVGFTELGPNNELFNAAAVFHQGRVAGIYRKLHPAIRKSVYSAGSATPVFRVGHVVFGIAICNDSNYPSLRGASLSKEPQSSSSRQTTDCRRGVPKRTWFGRPGPGIRGQLSRTGSGCPRRRCRRIRQAQVPRLFRSGRPARQL